jgi:DNA anti-recombination protein RmuC
MSIFNSESENERFERHMRPIRALNENKRLRLIRDQLRKDLQLQRKQLRTVKTEQAKLEKELARFASTIRTTSETPYLKAFQSARGPEGNKPKGTQGR